VIRRTNPNLDPGDQAATVDHRQPKAPIMHRLKFPAAAALAVITPAAQAQQVTITSDQPLPYSEHCLGSDALQAAKALYLHDYDFAVGDPAKSEGLLDSRLSDRLAKNFACEQDGVCAIEADTWTGAQDGAVAEPITITPVDDPVANGLTSTKVRVAYTFVLEGQKPEAMSTILEFARSGGGQCWKLFDMTSGDGSSLIQQLIDYQDKP
jgi:hypothetical protein